jgi:hypothetical protein
MKLDFERPALRKRGRNPHLHPSDVRSLSEAARQTTVEEQEEVGPGRFGSSRKQEAAGVCGGRGHLRAYWVFNSVFFDNQALTFGCFPL